MHNALILGHAHQQANLKMLHETLIKGHPKTVKCSVCGKTIPVKRAIIRDDTVFCEECFNKRTR